MIGGAKKSQHMDGKAADLNEYVFGNEHLFKRILALKLPFDCMINEFNFDWIHISFNREHNRELILESYFDEGQVKYKNYGG